MLAFVLSFFRMLWLFGKDHHGVVLENLALRQQLSTYKRKQQRLRLADRDRWFWIALSVLWKEWRRALVVVHPDEVTGAEPPPYWLSLRRAEVPLFGVAIESGFLGG